MSAMQLAQAEIDHFRTEGYLRVPEFFTAQVRKDLGPFYESLPADALHHDPNAYLMSETVQPSMRSARA